LPLLTPRPDSGYGYNQAPIFLGNLKFKDVHFSYIPDEEVIKGIDLGVNAAKPWPLWVLQVQENRLSIY
jgi:hypothetical protein